MSREPKTTPQQTPDAADTAPAPKPLAKYAIFSAKGILSLLAVGAVGAAALVTSQIREVPDTQAPYQPQVQLSAVTYPYVCMPLLASDEGVAPGTVQLRLDSGAQLVSIDELGDSASKAITPKLVEDATTGGQSQSFNAQKLPLSFTLQTDGQAQVQGSSAVTSNTETVTGTSVQPCQLTSTQAWFVAGSTAVEHSTFLVVANPAPTAIDVSIQAWGAAGPLENTAHLTVPGGAYRAVNLATYFPEEERLAVHASSSGGTAAFSLHVNSTHGLSAKGFARLNAVTAPARTQVIASVDDQAQEATLRLANPGSEPAQVSVKVATDAGAVALPGAESMTVDEGGVFEVSLADVASKSGGLIIESTRPILASASGYYPAATDEQKDRTTLAAWSATEPSAKASAVIPTLAEGKIASQKVVLINPAKRAVTVTVAGTDYTVEAGASKRVEVTGNVIEMTASQPVVANLELTVERNGHKEYLSTGFQPAEASVPITTLEIAR